MKEAQQKHPVTFRLIDECVFYSIPLNPYVCDHHCYQADACASQPLVRKLFERYAKVNGNGRQE